MKEDKELKENALESEVERILEDVLCVHWDDISKADADNITEATHLIMELIQKDRKEQKEKLLKKLSTNEEMVEVYRNTSSILGDVGFSHQKMRGVRDLIKEKLEQL